MIDEKAMTALNTSVGADAGQSSTLSADSISDSMEEFNDYFWEQKMRRLSDPSYLNTISMTELFGTPFETKPPIVEGMLYRGTYLFVGAPKVGKSFLVAQLAYHVSMGLPLWDYPVRHGTVLYLALEDNYRRLQERLYRMFGAVENPYLFFSVDAGIVGKGLDAQLESFLVEHPETSLIIIDTLQKVRELGGEAYSYASDYKIISMLKAIADKHDICLLLVHHTRKQNADDKFDTISGTNGLLGAADGAFMLTKVHRTESSAMLDVSSRDMQDMRFNLIRNETTLAWELEDVETELWKEPAEPILGEIAKHISEENPEWSGTPTELVTLLGVDMQPNTLTTKLNVNVSRLKNDFGIGYENRRTHAGRVVRLRWLGTP